MSFELWNHMQGIQISVLVNLMLLLAHIQHKLWERKSELQLRNVRSTQTVLVNVPSHLDFSLHTEATGNSWSHQFSKPFNEVEIWTDWYI